MKTTHPAGASSTFHAKDTEAADLKRTVAVGIGNFLEWFDFAIYGYFAGVIGLLFFPSDAPGVSLLSSLAVFAVGFISRPFGAAILGPIGDRLGRRAVLIITVFGMGVCTCIIGLLPTYQSLGVAAPVLLIVLRFIQGMMVGGEWSSAGIFVIESAQPGKRARAAAIITGTAGAAFLFGTVIAAIISSSLTDQQVNAWGWRLPFVASVVMAAVAMFIRRKLGDTPVYEALEHKRRTHQLEHVSRQTKVHAFVTAFAFSALFGVSLYYFITYASTHLMTAVGLPKSQALWLCGIALAVYCVMHPLVGAFSDRFGRRKLLLTAAAGLTVLAYPIFMMLNTGNSLYILLGLIVLAVLVSITAVMDVVLLVEVFPASIRSTGAALGHNIALAILAGPGPFIAAALIRQTGNPNMPAFYLAGVSFVCLLVLMKRLPETKDNDIAQG